MNNVKPKRLVDALGNEHGAVAAMTAIFLLVLLAFAAAAIDIGHALVAKNELQNAADAGALAGTRALGIIYEGMTPALQQTYTLTSGDQATIEAAVRTTAEANRAAGVSITIDNSGDIAIGTWNPATRVHTAPANPPTAVRVWARRDASANGAISTFLAGVVGLTSISVSAVATANLGALNAVAPGDMNAPLTISEFYFNSGFGCGSTIQFSPSIPGNPQTCTGWTAYNQGTPSGQVPNGTLVNMINQMAQGNNPTPGATGGQTQIATSNGNLGNPAWTALQNLLQYNINTYGEWNALVPVYAGDDCSPSGWQTVVGFATVKITYVGGPGDPNNAANCTGNTATGCIAGQIQCDVFNGTVGGGVPFGPTYATIPGLVE